jgi:RND family efflux transporter MFP subunit
MNRSTVHSLLLACGLAAVGLPALSQDAVETALAQYRTVERERVLDGIVEAVNQATVSAQVSARVTEIYFDVDDFVEQGKLLVRFDDSEYRARLNQAIASKEAVAANLERARAQFERIENLYDRRTVSKAEYDQARAELGTVRAELDSAEAVIAQIEKQLEYTLVRAPYSGIVTERHIELGETANPGSPLMSGFSLDQLRAVVEFPQRLISAVKEHRKARVLIPGRDNESIAAESITIFPYAQEGASTITVRVRLPDNTKEVFPGMLVKVAFSMGGRLQLSVPEQALVYRSEVVGVYVVDSNEKVSFRHVRTGTTDPEGMAEILSGLDDGERVALNPAVAAARLTQQRAMLEQ